MCIYLKEILIYIYFYFIYTIYQGNDVLFCHLFEIENTQIFIDYYKNKQGRKPLKYRIFLHVSAFFVKNNLKRFFFSPILKYFT